MTTVEIDRIPTRTEWLDSVVAKTEQHTQAGTFASFKNWVTGLVYGVESTDYDPSQHTFDGQMSQTPSFEGPFFGTVPSNIIRGEE